MMEVGRLECTQERRVVLVSSNFYASFVLSKRPACTLKHESIVMIMLFLLVVVVVVVVVVVEISDDIIVVNIHNFLLATRWDLDFLFAASSKQIGEAQDIIDNPSRSTVGGKRSDKYMYVFRHT